MNVEGPSRDCAPQTHTPCEGTSAQSEDAAHRQVSSAPAVAGEALAVPLASRGTGEPQPLQFLFPLSADSFLFAYFCSSFLEL